MHFIDSGYLNGFLQSQDWSTESGRSGARDAEDSSKQYDQDSLERD
jgi:hypothetical protein